VAVGRDLPPVARWSVGGAFLEAFAQRDYAQMVATLSPDVCLRVLQPTGPQQWHGAESVADVFNAWFGRAQDFELVDAAVGEVGGRLHLSWRVQVRPAPSQARHGWHVIEQQAYADAGDRISALDLLSSGFQPGAAAVRLPT